jgi:hypothetical protein
MDRFDDRSTRLARRQESDVFAHYVMPVSWVVGLVGLLALIALSFSQNGADTSQGSLVPVFAAFLAAPFVMLVVRLSRGHFHKDIRDKRTKI